MFFDERLIQDNNNRHERKFGFEDKKWVTRKKQTTKNDYTVESVNYGYPRDR